jgi:hypothetical protein
MKCLEGARDPGECYLLYGCVFLNASYASPSGPLFKVIITGRRTYCNSVSIIPGAGKQLCSLLHRVYFIRSLGHIFAPN